MDDTIACLTVSDWEGNWSFDVKAPWDRSVAEVIDAARVEAELPLETTFRAMQRGRELHALDTLRDAGVDENVEIDVYPEVIAGCSR